MFDTSNFFNTLFIIPILNALVVLYKGLLFLHLPGALGLALILLTVSIRLLLHPFTKAQLQSTQKLSKLKPQLDAIQKTYKDDKQRLQQEQLKLYQEAGVNPAAGCLPLLIQMPILIALYNLFFSILSSADSQKVIEGINKVVYASWLRIDSLDLSFFGMHLAHKPNEWQQHGWWLLAIPIITGLLQYWQTKMMVPSQQTTNNKQQITKNAKEEKKEEKEDMAATMQKQMTIMMPLMIGFFAYSFPLGLSLYWNTFTIFGIIQQYQMAKEK
jgi:YidC/Oxa1 family membrane protein insertase